MAFNSTKPVIRHILNLWTLVWHPSKAREWSLDRKIAALKDAGFDGFMDHLTPHHRKCAERLDLRCVGFFRSSKPDDFESLLKEQQDYGALHVNVHLGEHDTPASDALRMARKLISAGEKTGIKPSIEVHRDTCTETPEKTYALADAYAHATGELLPMTWDYSHLAVVKHLQPPYWDRLGVRQDLLRRSQQIHFRPFNGHHCQVPVTNGRGKFTPEFLDYAPFLDRVLAAWLEGAEPGRELIAVPELGPLWLGYGLHAFPPSWDESQVVRREIDRRWMRALKRWTAVNRKTELKSKVAK